MHTYMHTRASSSHVALPLLASLSPHARTGQNTEITRCHALLTENHIPLPKPLPTSLPFALTEGAKGGGKSARGAGDSRASGGLTPSASVGTIGGLRADEAEWAASLKVGERMLAESVGVHPGVACDRSGQCPIIGYRYTLKGKLSHLPFHSIALPHHSYTSDTFSCLVPPSVQARTTIYARRSSRSFVRTRSLLTRR